VRKVAIAEVRQVLSAFDDMIFEPSKKGFSLAYGLT
jgi:hypothetical protein